MTTQQTIGTATYQGRAVTVTLESWQCNGRTLYTPKCSEFGLGGRDFARMHSAISYAKRVTGMREVA